MTERNVWLVIGGGLSLAAALLHVGCIIGGAKWYRFFGAGEGMARAVERQEWRPAIITSGIVVVLLIWAAYAFAGAGLIGRMPLMRSALVAISAIYLARALVAVPIALMRPPGPFLIWSSLVVLVFGLTYAIGTWQAWPRLSGGSDGADAVTGRSPSAPARKRDAG